LIVSQNILEQVARQAALYGMKYLIPLLDWAVLVCK